MELSELEVKLKSLRDMRDKISEDIAMIHRDMKKVIAKSSANEGKKQTTFPIVRDFNFLVGDVDEEVVDVRAVFGNERVFFADNLFDCLVQAGCFESKGQARKNWKGPELEFGFQEIGPIGKGKVHLFIWNLEKNEQG